MNKDKLLFNKEYEGFYEMVEENEIFAKFCVEVFGIDFSQDGYSDLEQIQELIKAADIKSEYKVLDIGCGNGKMAEYIAEQTGAEVHGFDYSENAIKNAKIRTEHKSNLSFEEGIIGEKQYDNESYDVILSVDSMCFALDLEAFVTQIFSWLKPGGVFVSFYEEGHLKGLSNDENNTELAIAFINNKIEYETQDFTKQHYELMKRKREVITKMKDEFLEKKMDFYYFCSMDTSVDTEMELEDFERQFRRVMYIAIKSNTEKEK